MAQRIAQGMPRWHLPSWKQVGFGILAVVLMIVAAVGVIGLATDWFSSSAQVESRQTETMDTAPVVAENPPAIEPDQAETFPAPVALPVVEAKWGEPIPIVVPLRGGPEDTYSGKSGNKGPTPEKLALARSILPSLPEERGLFVSASKDLAASQYILVGIHTIDDKALREALEQGLSLEEINKRHTVPELGSRLFLSRDEENSWEEISLPSDLLTLLAVQITVGDSLQIEVTEDHNSWRPTVLPLGN